MVTCSKCGTENREDAKFCTNCGTPLYSAKRRERREGECFGEDRRGRDYLGLVSFGIFLIIVGIVITINRNIFSIFRLWIVQLTNQRAWIRPPKGLINSATLFFSLIGVSNFFIAGIRFIVDKGMRQTLTDILSGIALVFFAYLINLYGSYMLRLRMVLGIETVVCGLLVISYVIVQYVFFARLKGSE